MLVSQGPAAEQHQQDRFRTCINRTRCPLQPGSGRGPAAAPKPFVAPCGLGQYRGCPLARARQRACVSPQTFLFLQFGQASDAFSQGPAQGQHYQHQDQIAFVSAGLCLHDSDARLLAKAQQRASISSISPQPFLPLQSDAYSQAQAEGQHQPPNVLAPAVGPASGRCLQPSPGRGPASDRFGSRLGFASASASKPLGHSATQHQQHESSRLGPSSAPKPFLLPRAQLLPKTRALPVGSLIPYPFFRVYTFLYNRS